MNIVDLNYSDSFLKSVKSANLLKSVYKILKKILFELAKDFYFIFRCNPKNRIVIFSTSTNQYSSIKPVHKELNNSKLFGLNGKSEYRIPMGIGCLFSLLLTPKFIYDLLTKYNSDKKKIISHLDNFFFIEGIATWWILYFTLFKPKCILLANDHNLWHRVIRYAGNKRNIPTVYIQHASVSNRFPPLEFTLSLLEGEHAKNTYNNIRRNNNIRFIGMTKFDNYFPHINKSSVIEKIGICTNTLDRDDIIFELVKSVKIKFSELTVLVRPHPLDKRDELYKKMKNELKIDLSDSNSENSFEFLSKVDMMISGESSIHLEAALMNVYPIYFNMGSSMYDYYEYIKNGVTEEVKDTKNLIEKINFLKIEKPDIRSNAKFYVDTVNTEYDGKSTQLALREIHELLRSKEN